MDGLDAGFYILVAVFLFTLGYLHVKALTTTEGFESVPSATPASSSSSIPTSQVEQQIRAALDPYLNPDLCDAYTEIRSVLAQSIQGNTLTPTADTLTKVEAYLAKEITLPLFHVQPLHIRQERN